VADDTIMIEEVAHSKRGASGAHRWMNCAGSIPLTDKIVAKMKKSEQDSFFRGGPAASEGSAAHEIAAICLKNGQDAWEYAGRKIVADGREFVVDDEMVLGVQLHIDTVQELLELYADQGALLYVETSLESCLDEDAFGTGDVIIFVPGVIIIVIDFKYGRGVVVEPDSAQNKIYGYMAFEGFEADDIEDVQLWITQPRIPHPKGRARKYETTTKALEEWFVGDVVPAMQASRDTKANLTIGDWCRFCPAKDKCPALTSETSNFDMTLSPNYMTGDELGELMIKGKSILAYLDKLKEEAFRRVRRGEDVKGQKLVRKQANRVLKKGAEDAAKKKWGDEAYTTPKLKSVAQLEKLDGGKTFASRHGFTPDNGFTIAPTSDKREAIVISGEEFFGDDVPY